MRLDGMIQSLFHRRRKFEVRAQRYDQNYRYVHAVLCAPLQAVIPALLVSFPYMFAYPVGRGSRKCLFYTSTASQTLHGQHKIPSCLRIISSPCWNPQNVRCRFLDTVVTERSPTHALSARLEGAHDLLLVTFTVPVTGPLLVSLIDKEANGPTKSALSVTDIVDDWLESRVYNSWSSEYLEEKLLLLARVE